MIEQNVRAPYLRCNPNSGWHGLIGVGGIGSGLFFELEGDHTLGRNESRPARLLDSRDYCKLHIIAHYVAVLMGSAQGSGFHVLPAGKVGADARGLELRDEMAATGMDTRAIDLLEDRPTALSVCFQYPDGSGGNITANDSACSALMPEDVDRAEALLAAPKSGYIALAAPEVPLETRAHLLRRARSWGGFGAAAFTSSEMAEAVASGMLSSVDLLAINQDELEALIGESVDPAAPEPTLARCAGILTEVQPHIRIVVTLGSRGAFGFEDGAWRHSPALPVTPASTAGAGDALLGGILCALSVGAPFLAAGPQRSSLAGGPIESALEFGVLIAGYKITSRHTIHPDADLAALLEFAGAHGITLAGALTAESHDGVKSRS